MGRSRFCEDLGEGVLGRGEGKSLFFDLGYG